MRLQSRPYIDWKNTTAYLSMALRSQTISYMLPLEDNKLLIDCCREGRHDIVRLLLRDGRADPTIRGGRPLVMAVEAKHCEVVRLLLSDSRVDPSACDGWYVVCAIQNNDANTLRVLIADPRMEKKHLTSRRHSEQDVDCWYQASLEACCCPCSLHGLLSLKCGQSRAVHMSILVGKLQCVVPSERHTRLSQEEGTNVISAVLTRSLERLVVQEGRIDMSTLNETLHLIQLAHLAGNQQL